MPTPWSTSDRKFPVNFLLNGSAEDQSAAQSALHPLAGFSSTEYAFEPLEQEAFDDGIC